MPSSSSWCSSARSPPAMPARRLDHAGGPGRRLGGAGVPRRGRRHAGRAIPTRAACCSPTTGRRASTRCAATSPTTASRPRPRAWRRVLKQPPEGASVLPIGPFFPVLEEPSYWRLFVEGETVVGCDYRGFYNHRGIEKLGDSVLTYNEIPLPRRADLRHLRVHPLDLLLPGGGEGGRDRGAAARPLHPHDHARARADPLAPAVAGDRRPHPRLRHRADADLAHARAGDVAARGDQRQPQDLRHEHDRRPAPRPASGRGPEDPQGARRGRARVDRGARRDRRRHHAAGAHARTSAC